MTRKEKRERKAARKQLAKQITRLIAQPISIRALYNNDILLSGPTLDRHTVMYRIDMSGYIKLQAYVPGSTRIAYKVVYENEFGSHVARLVDKLGDNLWYYINGTHHIYINRGGAGTVAITQGHSNTPVHAQCVALSMPLWAVLIVGKHIEHDGNDMLSLKGPVWWQGNERAIQLERRLTERHAVLEGGTAIPLPMYVQRHVSRKIEAGKFFPLPAKFNRKLSTGAHLSTIDDRLIAYYPTPRHQRELLAQRIKPGKYLKKYYPDMTDDEIRVMANRVSAGTELKFFSKGEDMVKYYMALSKDGIVSSCMSKMNWDTHPLMAYDNSDVELAVLFSGGEPIARAVYNKHNKHYAMVYGQWERMKHALDAAGFIHADLIGAKINKIEIPGRKGAYLLPYIDAHRALSRTGAQYAYVMVRDDHIEVTASGIAANQYEAGFIRVNDSYYDDDEEDMCTCVHCDDRIPAEEAYIDEMSDDTVCAGCWGEYAVEVYRHGYSTPMVTTYNTDSYIYIDGRHYEGESAAEYHGWVYSHYENEYLRQDDAWWSETENTYVSCDNTDFFDDGAGNIYLVQEAIDNAYFDVDILEVVWDENEDTIPLEYLRYSEHFDEYARELPEHLADAIPCVMVKPELELEQAFTMVTEAKNDAIDTSVGVGLTEMERRATALLPLPPLYAMTPGGVTYASPPTTSTGVNINWPAAPSLNELYAQIVQRVDPALTTEQLARLITQHN